MPNNEDRILDSLDSLHNKVDEINGRCSAFEERLSGHIFNEGIHHYYGNCPVNDELQRTKSNIFKATMAAIGAILFAAGTLIYNAIIGK